MPLQIGFPFPPRQSSVFPRNFLSLHFSVVMDEPSRAAGAPKRRKVRKGTQSCWECKRRKVRCTFSEPSERGVCDGCKGRGTACVGQEFPDEPLASPAGAGTRALGDRLGQVEARVEKLIREIDRNHRPSGQTEQSIQACVPTPADSRRGKGTESPRLVSFRCSVVILRRLTLD
jgi:hypothetical protein